MIGFIAGADAALGVLVGEGLTVHCLSLSTMGSHSAIGDRRVVEILAAVEARLEALGDDVLVAGGGEVGDGRLGGVVPQEGGHRLVGDDASGGAGDAGLDLLVVPSSLMHAGHMSLADMLSRGW
jgi:hypothetical protein